MAKKNKPIAYTLGEREATIGKHKGTKVIQARPSGRKRVTFEAFTEMVAKNTTLNYMEVQSVLNLAADLAKDLVANGDIVDFGRLGTLLPSFKSKTVPVGEEFNAGVHITEPKVLLRPNPVYFKLEEKDVSYERIELKPRNSSKKATPEPEKPSGGGSGGSSESPF